MTLETYPGTDLLIRLCYGCGEQVADIAELWVDFDSNCCVCSECREHVRDDYDTYDEWIASVVPARTLVFDTINEMEEG